MRVHTTQKPVPRLGFIQQLKATKHGHDVNISFVVKNIDTAYLKWIANLEGKPINKQTTINATYYVPSDYLSIQIPYTSKTSELTEYLCGHGEICHSPIYSSWISGAPLPIFIRGDIESQNPLLHSLSDTYDCHFYNFLYNVY